MITRIARSDKDIDRARKMSDIIATWGPIATMRAVGAALRDHARMAMRASADYGPHDSAYETWRAGELTRAARCLDCAQGYADPCQPALENGRDELQRLAACIDEYWAALNTDPLDVGGARAAMQEIRGLLHAMIARGKCQGE